MLTVDPILSDLNRPDDSEVCAEYLSVSGRSEEEEERSAGRSTYCSASSSKSHFSVPKIDFVGKFEIIKIKPNEMIKNFRTNFVKTETGSKLNPNCEPYVPTGSSEQVFTSSSPRQSDCDVKPFDPQEFYQKVCCYACGRPGYIAKNCLHRPTEFFYVKNQKVTP
ncbi:hypothetical protein R6Q57_021340 [Mikania cordata]